MPDRLQFDVGFGPKTRPRNEDEPMRLLVLGDFSGQSTKERPPLASRPTMQVDLDNFDDVMRKLAPRLRLSAGEIELTKLDDFHPDRLSDRLDLFRTLREQRANPPAENNDLLARLLGKAPDANAAAPATPANRLDALIHNIVAPHIVKDTSAQTKPFVDAIDAALAEQMRGVLHDATFQALESTWRGVHWLISSLELDENLQLHLFDVGRDELIADIVAVQGKITETGLYRALVDRWRNVPGGKGWSAITALFQFGPSDADIGLLAALGIVASQAGGPLLSGADRALTGENQDEFHPSAQTTRAGGSGLKAWHTLRHSEAAPWIALAAPRVLLRLPYGKRSDPIDAFPFEEFAGAPLVDKFLWGNAALALAVLIGRSFSARGWDMELGDEREIGDLPAYTFAHDGETQMQPCAEQSLSESGIQQLLNAGLVPLASRRDRNAVVAIRFQSISDPPAPLVW